MFPVYYLYFHEEKVQEVPALARAGTVLDTSPYTQDLQLVS